MREKRAGRAEERKRRGGRVSNTTTTTMIVRAGEGEILSDVSAVTVKRTTIAPTIISKPTSIYETGNMRVNVASYS